MTAHDVLLRQSQRTGEQLHSLLDDFPSSSVDFRVHDRAMTCREMVGHLCESYQALLTTASGDQHSWGSYVPAAGDWVELVGSMFELRESAMESLLDAKHERLWSFLSNILAHDSYHVGQLTLIRLAIDPDWS